MMIGLLTCYFLVKYQDPGGLREIDACTRAYDLSYSYCMEVGSLAEWSIMVSHKYKSKNMSISSHQKFFKENKNSFVVQINPHAVGHNLLSLPKKTKLLKVFRKNGEYLLYSEVNGFSDGPFLRHEKLRDELPPT
jgi:hypothetical protein